MLEVREDWLLWLSIYLYGRLNLKKVPSRWPSLVSLVCCLLKYQNHFLSHWTMVSLSSCSLFLLSLFRLRYENDNLNPDLICYLWLCMLYAKNTSNCHPMFLTMRRLCWNYFWDGIDRNETCYSYMPKWTKRKSRSRRWKKNIWQMPTREEKEQNSTTEKKNRERSFSTENMFDEKSVLQLHVARKKKHTHTKSI